MTRVLLTILAFSLVAAPALGEEKEAFKLIKASELQKMMKAPDSRVAVYDANWEGIREKWGMIPGAKPLSKFEFDASKELPADKTTPLVFYCGNQHCTASHHAAGIAMKAGFNDVSVLSDGIMGWARSGKPVVHPK